MSTDKVRLGIIGCGVISASHLELAGSCPDVTVVAVADLIEERARERAKRFGVETIYFSDRQLLKDDRIEAVVLAMPAGVRTPVAYRALRCGKHVLLEKPIARTAAEVRRMIALRGDRVVGCCSPRFAFSAHARAAAACVASGALGKIRMVRFRAIGAAGAKPYFDPPPPWRQSMSLNGGGVLVNWSCYDLNYLMYITGWQLRPLTALARWWGPGPQVATTHVAAGSDADSHFTAMILCDDDIVLSMERGEFVSASGEQAWEIIGSDGTLHLPMLPPAGKPNQIILDQFVPGQGVVSRPIWTEGQGDNSGNVITDFVRAIQQGGQTETNLERALVMQRITDAIYASARKGRSVAV